MDSVYFGSLYLIPSSNGVSRPSAVRGRGYKMINMGELFAHNIIRDIPMELSPKERLKFLVQENDLLFARQSLVAAGAGKCSIVKQLNEETTFESHLIRVRLDEQICNPLYYYYLFQLPYNPIKSIVNQCAQAGIRGKELSKVKVPRPKIKTQTRIASILSSYDDSIENNNKRIKILEQMAENLYKEWFVRFRFPGYEQAEFENGMPKGWKVCKLREIIRIRYGKDHKDLVDGTIPVFGSGGVMRYGNRALYSGETVMIPRKGSLHNVTYYKGDLWTVDTMFYTEFKVPTCASYLYFTLSQFDLESLNKGASIPSLSTDILYNLKIVLPPQWLLTQFQQMIDVLNAQTEKLTQQNHNLTKQRDMLLPRLMSGKLEL